MISSDRSGPSPIQTKSNVVVLLGAATLLSGAIALLPGSHGTDDDAPPATLLYRTASHCNSPPFLPRPPTASLVNDTPLRGRVSGKSPLPSLWLAGSCAACSLASLEAVVEALLATQLVALCNPSGSFALLIIPPFFACSCRFIPIRIIT
ncbi:hypothetical protein E2562_028302 [Oryza meyeriana var. granulata]|uniref:Uncharacterized protein n=1 Tax=Oryza meyeriana var. granulata TaxID=110450 RepID=A0A6G1E2T0_9ORYZ|nr:hypothetical protein E2562_028302 [Oryza meyeriana var. granulata]